MTGKIAVIAVTARWVLTVHAKGGAVSLDVTNALAVVALLCLGGPGQGTVARLVVCRNHVLGTKCMVELQVGGEILLGCLPVFKC